MPNKDKQSAIDALWQVLWDKHETLIDFLQKMNDVSPEDRPDSEGPIRNAELEVQRIEVLMNALYSNQVPPFPSDDQIEAMKEAVGALQAAVKRGDAAEALISAATAAVKTWPVSGGG